MRFKSLLLASLVACSDTGEPPIPDGEPEGPTKTDDSEYRVSGARGWYLAGNALTPGNDKLELSITGPSDSRVVDLWIDGRYTKRAYKAGGKFTFAIDIRNLPIGAHRVLLAADGERTAFADVRFTKSHPLYVVVSNDWDDPDNSDATLERQERLHARHPNLVLTHFVGPYTFTDSRVTPARRQRL